MAYTMANERANLDRMVREAQELAESIIAQRDRIADAVKRGANPDKDRERLNKMIEHAESLTKRITELQNRILSERASVEATKPNIPAQQRAATVKAKNINRERIEDLSKNSTSVKIDNSETAIKRRQKELTVDQIEAVGGINPEYFGVSADGKSNNNVASEISKYRCAWHPWRQAYEICSYCGKPYCFEDIVEKRGRFYCLEDVDKMPIQMQQARGDLGSFGMLSGALMMLTFIMFLYFGYSQFAYQLNSLIVSLPNLGHGLVAISQFYNFVNAFPLLAFVLTLISFLVGITVMGHTKRSFVYGVTLNMLSVMLFSYAYLSYIRVYILFISVISFASMILLLISKGVEYQMMEESEENYMNTNISNLGF